MSLWYLLSALSLFYILIGRILTTENAPYLLSGYNTLSAEEQKKVNLAAYVPFFRKFHLWLGLGHFTVGSLLFYLWSEDAAGLFLGICPILAYLWFMSHSRRFMAGVQERQIRIARYVLIACALLVSGLMLIGQGNIPFEVQADGLRIGGIYGETLPRNNLSSVQLVDALPDIKWKTHGFATGSAKKGYFRTRDGRSVKLMLNHGVAPYLLLTRQDGRQIYYACGSRNNRLLWAQIDSLMPEKTKKN
ncbi:MAG: DUF3784 domain-containing protein [Sphingomonadales bacterium]|nr:DUF3784 domain-containing protein [Sphingomonadales bacterium]